MQPDDHGAVRPGQPHTGPCAWAAAHAPGRWTCCRQHAACFGGVYTYVTLCVTVCVMRMSTCGGSAADLVCLPFLTYHHQSSLAQARTQTHTHTITPHDTTPHHNTCRYWWMLHAALLTCTVSVSCTMMSSLTMCCCRLTRAAQRDLWQSCLILVRHLLHTCPYRIPPPLAKWCTLTLGNVALWHKRSLTDCDCTPCYPTSSTTHMHLYDTPSPMHTPSPPPPPPHCCARSLVLLWQPPPKCTYMHTQGLVKLMDAGKPSLTNKSVSGTLSHLAPERLVVSGGWSVDTLLLTHTSTHAHKRTCMALPGQYLACSGYYYSTTTTTSHC